MLNLQLFEKNLPSVGPKLSVDQIEAGGLAGAVRADHRQQFARFDGKTDSLDSTHAAEGFRKFIDRENVHFFA